MRAETSRTRDWDTILLAGVMLVGFALRTVAIGRESLWTDEALTLVIAHLPVWDMITKPTDPTPFLYYGLHKWFVPDGAGVVAVRGISLVAGMLTLPVVYAIGRMMFSGAGALLATALVALSPPLIDYSQEARAYSLLVLLVAASAMFLLLALRDQAARRRRLALAGFAASSVAAFYTHFIALFWVAPALLILRICLPRAAGREAMREAWLAIAVVVLMSVPEAGRVARYATAANGFNWLTQLSPLGIVDLLARMWLPAGVSPIGRWAGLVLVAALAGLGLIRRKVIAEWARQRPQAPLIIAALCLQPLALWLFGYVVSPVLMERTMLPSLIGVALLLTLLVQLLERPARQIVTGAVLVAALGSLAFTGTVRAKEDWRGAERQLAATQSPLIIACPYWQAPALLAAGAGAGRVPVATLSAKGIELVSQEAGDRGTWHRHFYRRVHLAQSAIAVSEAPAPATTRRIWVSEFTLVTGTCTAREREALSTWFRPDRVDRIWQSRAPDSGVVIRIQRWHSNEPRPLRLVVHR
jgi:mannosyltransferase